jgi:hypothetical protein
VPFEKFTSEAQSQIEIELKLCQSWLKFPFTKENTQSVSKQAEPTHRKEKYKSFQPGIQ